MMRKFLLLRRRIRNEVEKLIEKEFEDDWNYSFSITKENKIEDPEEYENNLRVFHFVFSSAENGKIYLWNELNRNYSNAEFPYDEGDFSEEELAFLRKASVVPQGSVDSYKNNNKPFFTERLELSPIKSEEDSEFLWKDLVNSGVSEFEKTTCTPFYDVGGYGADDGDRDRSYFCDLPLIFGIYLEGKIIGTVGFFSLWENSDKYSLVFYLIREQRGHGYLREAIDKLLELAFSRQLVIKTEKLYGNVFETIAPQINFVGIYLADHNENEINLAKEIGAVYDGKDSFLLKLSDGYHDLLNFTLVNPNFKR